MYLYTYPPAAPVGVVVYASSADLASLADSEGASSSPAGSFYTHSTWRQPATAWT